MSRRLLAAVAACLPVAVLPACHEHNVTAPTLQATCEAQPGSGPAPLPVAFALSVAGASGAFTVSINYGDGSTGSDPAAKHTYIASGIYVASFDVTTATQSARCSATVSVASGTQPAPVVDQPPVAVFKTVPEARQDSLSGTAPFTVRFNMCATSDPESDVLWFRMDFDGDGGWDSVGTTGAHCRKDFTYAAGTYHARICVHDIGPNGEQLHDDQCKTYQVTAKP